MNFVDFERQWEKQGAFSINEIRMWCHDFDRNNLGRWVSKGYLSRLRNGWYAFTSAMRRAEFPRFVAGRIYNPSYISLETALSAYDIIPEGVTDITSISSKKTTKFINDCGNFFYYSVKPQLMFGYKPVPTPDRQYYMLALPEKAILDFLYLHPEYTTVNDMLELRFDELFLDEDLDKQRLDEFTERFGSNALTTRVKTLKNAYCL